MHFGKVAINNYLYFIVAQPLRINYGWNHKSRQFKARKRDPEKILSDFEIDLMRIFV